MVDWKFSSELKLHNSFVPAGLKPLREYHLDFIITGTLLTNLHDKAWNCKYESYWLRGALLEHIVLTTVDLLQPDCQ